MLIKRSALFALACLCAASAWADGVTDVVIPPSTGLAISTSGHYRLVSNVTLTANVSAIVVGAANVTLDLNGHTITAAAGSTLEGVFCASSGLTLMNGSFGGFGLGALTTAGARVTVRNIKAVACCKGGGSVIQIGTDGIVEDCILTDNIPVSGSVYGITAGNGTRIQRNTIDNNDSPDASVYGIFAAADCIIVDNIVRNNTVIGGGSIIYGIYTGDHCIIRGNNVINNDTTGTGSTNGIYTGIWCFIERNVASGHTTGSSGSGVAYGIRSSGSSTILDNYCENNDAGSGTNGSAYGILTGGLSDVRNNHCNSMTAQGTGVAVGISGISSDNISGNYCIGNAGGANSWGIRMTGTLNTVVSNTCTNNGTAGLYFASATSNRADSNRLRQTTPIDLANGGVNPVSLGAGDLANISY